MEGYYDHFLKEAFCKGDVCQLIWMIIFVPLPKEVRKNFIKGYLDYIDPLEKFSLEPVNFKRHPNGGLLG